MFRIFLHAALIVVVSILFNNALATNQENRQNQSLFLGVNYNESLELVDESELALTKTKWARGFIPYDLYASGKRDLSNDDRIEGFKRLKKLGYNTILSLKFNYRKRDLPKTEDELVDHLAYTFKLLDELYNYADIIVAGNEPFIESKLDQRGDVLVTFYQVVAGLVNNYQTQKGGNKPIYVGAFNRLWEPKMQKDATALFTFARETPWIAGVDLHIHHASNEQFNTMMEFAEARLRDDQTIIATEFSLMHHWRQSLTQPIPNILHTQYSYPNDWKVYDFLNYSLNTQPVTRQEWVDFLSNSDWFENRKHYIKTSWDKFTQYPKFLGATYGLYQTYGNQPFVEGKDPWILNSLYSNRTVIKKSHLPEFHYQFMNDFIAVQGYKRAKQ